MIHFQCVQKPGVIFAKLETVINQDRLGTGFYRQSYEIPLIIRDPRPGAEKEKTTPRFYRSCFLRFCPEPVLANEIVSQRCYLNIIKVGGIWHHY
jgi:hypothetical protein